jgi:ribosomal protein L11 methyltransferase
LGCGSGILSITAMLLGARSALAVDIDPNAVDIAYENAALNGIRDGYRVLAGDAISDGGLREDISSQKYDVVVANIVADVIIALTGLAGECVKPGGYFITSGIIHERAEEVRKVLEQNFEIVSEAIRDEWVCIMGKRR